MISAGEIGEGYAIFKYRFRGCDLTEVRTSSLRGGGGRGKGAKGRAKRRNGGDSDEIAAV
jgi:hypothetical protein